jgi:hypothetical protein
MREEDLDELFSKLPERGKEQLAANFEAAVLRRIRARKDRESWFFYQVVIAFLRPSWVLSALLFAGLVGIAIGATTQGKRDKGNLLGLDAFSVQAPQLPSTVLQQIK